jgi:hypothetical protein
MSRRHPQPFLLIGRRACEQFQNRTFALQLLFRHAEEVERLCRQARVASLAKGV